MASQEPELTIVDAVREQENLYMALYGEGGTGKTLTALKMALYLTDGDASKILVIDTEARRSLHYAASTPGGKDGIPFKVVYLDTYSPANFITAFKTAGDQGIKCIIVDSMTHFWSGNGGLIEVNEKHGIKYFKGNTQAAWGKTNPVENKMHEAIDRFISLHGHVFLCFQQKPDSRSLTPTPPADCTKRKSLSCNDRTAASSHSKSKTSTRPARHDPVLGRSRIGCMVDRRRRRTGCRHGGPPSHIHRSSLI